MTNAERRFAQETGFATGRRWFNKSTPKIGQQTVTEMQAYCRVHGIPAPESGAWLAKQGELSSPVHPRCYGKQHPITQGRTTYLKGQREMFG